MDISSLAHEYRWMVFALSAAILFIIDFYGHKSAKGKEHEVNMKEAVLWSIFWVGAGLLFGLYVLFAEGADSASSYYASFVLEKGMSVDNIAVWLAILTGMSVAKDQWHRLLTWGIAGAIVFRGLFIFGGMNLMHQFTFLELILGVFLLWGAAKIIGLRFSVSPLRVYLAEEEEHFDPSESKIVKFITLTFKRLNIPLAKGSAMFAMVLFTIEITDVVFALDSVPVVIALNTSAFVAASSNLFAIFGLRALFFVVGEFLSRLEYLKYGLGATLLFIASKMIIGFHIEPMSSLLVITVILGAATVTSLLHKTPEEKVEEDREVRLALEVNKELPDSDYK